ncbi:MAG TPA: hypothetical protein VFA71_00765 [Terriglobales bacterium]|nr:hypothetical protein [Terriglobales bacterium]
MSRQQAFADELRRSMHDNLVRELRVRQRNIVFPDTVRNEGVFYRTLASKVIYTFTSHRIFAVLWGFYLLAGAVLFVVVISKFQGELSVRALRELNNWGWSIESLIWWAVGLKIAVNALVPDNPKPSPLPPKSYPRIKI